MVGLVDLKYSRAECETLIDESRSVAFRESLGCQGA